MGCPENTLLYPNSACNNSEGQIEKIALIKKGKYFTTPTSAATQADWTTKIQDEDVIILPFVYSYESADEGAVYDQTSYGSSHVRDGRKEFRITIDSNSDLHKRLRTLKSSGSYEVIEFYDSGLIKAYNPPGTTEVRGFATRVINTEFKMENDGSTAGKTPIFFSFKDPSQIEDYPILIKPTWNPSDLEALKMVDIDVNGSPSSSLVTVDVYLNHINPSVGSLTANPVEGLVTGDFLLLNGSTGAAQTITATESTTVHGRYALAGTGLVSGTVSLKDPSDMTTTGYKAVEAATVTIA